MKSNLLSHPVNYGGHTFYIINPEEAYLIMDNAVEKKSTSDERNLFLTNGSTVLAIDNTTGHPFLEEFKSIVSAVLYLTGDVDLEKISLVEKNFLPPNKYLDLD